MFGQLVYHVCSYMFLNERHKVLTEDSIDVLLFDDVGSLLVLLLCFIHFYNLTISFYLGHFLDSL
jgi:hypothetical protein